MALANCKQCGAQLPTFSFGDVSPYCDTCKAQPPPPAKQSMEDALAPLEIAFPRWFNATNILIAINVLVFVVMVARGVSWFEPTSADLLRWGADYGPSTLSGQYWRTVTSAFVHIGIIHIALNMLCLWSLGRLHEKLLGPLMTVGVYLVTAVGGDLLSLAWDPMRVGAGASGAIFGIAATLIPVLYYGKLGLPPENVRKLLGYVVRFSLLNLLYGFRSNVNNMAHLGGLVTGLLVGLFLAKTFSLPQEERGTPRKATLAVAGLAMVILLFGVTKAKSYAIDLQRGTEALDKGDLGTAIERLKKYTEAQPNDAYGHAVLGSALHQQKSYAQAASEYEQALQLHPNYRFVQLNLARVYLALDKPDKAVPLFKAAIAGTDPDAGTYFSYAYALKETGDLDGAEGAVRRAIQLDSKNQDSLALLGEIIEAKSAKALDASSGSRSGHSGKGQSSSRRQ